MTRERFAARCAPVRLTAPLARRDDPVLGDGTAGRTLHPPHANHRYVATALGDERGQVDVKAALAREAIAEQAMAVVEQLLQGVEDGHRGRLLPDFAFWNPSGTPSDFSLKLLC